jgi:hypothetical protein
VHVAHMLCPAEDWNCPASHSEQALTAEVSENVPTAHSVQELAPGSLPVLASEPAVHVAHMLCPAEDWNCPASHSEQALTAEVSENVPTAHSVQELAPGSLPVSVIEPAAQTTHAATFDTTENSPAAHAVQVVAPTAGPVSVIKPG